jgi:hypothetical protein
MLPRALPWAFLLNAFGVDETPLDRTYKTLASEGFPDYQSSAQNPSPARRVRLSTAAWHAPIDTEDREEAIAAGRKALADRGRIPWYDADKDVLQPVQVHVPSRYDLGWLFKPLFWFIVFLIVAALGILTWWIVRHISARNRALADKASNVANPSLAADWVEALPFLAQRSRDDLLGQARRHYEQGNYAEAIIYLFSYELVQLDRSALVQLGAGKTNRQYLRELSERQPIKRLLEQTTLAFEDVFFGGRSLDRAGFEACWNQLDNFEGLVAGAQVAS